MSSTFFAPMLYLKTVAPAIEFYKKAFGAVVLQQWNNDDGSVHVAEMEIGGALFHLHEDAGRIKELNPQTLDGTTVTIGLFVNDVNSIMSNAIAAGAKELHEVKDYEYGYRQGSFEDPFGHHWTIQKKIG